MTDEAMSPLRRRMIEDMTVRKFVEKTQKDYIRHVKDLTAFLGRSPGTATAEDSAPLSAAPERDRRPRAEHQQCGFGAAVLLLDHGRPCRCHQAADLRSSEPRKIPVVLSPEEVARFLEAAPGPKYKAALSAAYGAGLRVSEVVALKVSDVDSKRMLLRIEQGKGRKDRCRCSRPSCSSCCATGGGSRGPRSGCFPDRTGSTISPRASSTAPFMPPLRWPRSPSGCHRTRCGTASPPICWSRTSISG